ncbi:hypothetical protein NQ315_007499 [Exocentrus adspersus]|uniref:Uncharacterized protein n=1 Tax=Exocentrus adspersus TaxID=1586481 RepID=A0AAV8W7C7_9CUCU|nr:hypothetical protein NQ315_007499 [Exocentrus adspersus]
MKHYIYVALESYERRGRMVQQKPISAKDELHPSPKPSSPHAAVPDVIGEPNLIISTGISETRRDTEMVKWAKIGRPELSQWPGPTQKRAQEVTINEEAIQWSNNVKYLGVHLDGTMTWGHHVAETIRKALSGSLWRKPD